MGGVTVQRTSELLAVGLSQRDLSHAQTAGLRTKVRHGAYVDAVPMSMRRPTTSSGGIGS
jgi:hypothetical protein